jgi:hypothetical protein
MVDYGIHPRCGGRKRVVRVADVGYGVVGGTPDNEYLHALGQGKGGVRQKPAW